MSLGKNIQAARQSVGWTQKNLADALKVTPQMISQYERDAKKPKLKTVQKIADALHVSSAALLGMPLSPRTEEYESPTEEKDTIGMTIKKSWESQGYSESEIEELTGCKISFVIDKRDYEFAIDSSALMKFSAVLGIFWADFVNDDVYASDIWTYRMHQRTFPEEIKKMRRSFYSRSRNLANSYFLMLDSVEQELCLEEFQALKTSVPTSNYKSLDQEKLRQAREAVADLHLNAPADDTDSKDGGQ